MPELPSPESEHPARLAAWRSIDAVARGDREAWLDGFADDAVVEDPVGESILDPEGQGHRGKQAIAAFWDKNIAARRPIFSLQHSLVSGNECANVGTLMTQFENGAVSKIFGVFVYRVNDAGKVISLRTYWEMADMEMLPPLSKGETS
ncbi:MAG: nuclear transport factor 2 family protein [Deltaproteobacteria bacterium]|nr:nuclear transport factor 2 family protein [Deltaproteobacteria bacterium]MBW2396651.1 nuclear transport factor 2 family protein [Deltaproteobacteria bacterium]